MYLHICSLLTNETRDPGILPLPPARALLSGFPSLPPALRSNGSTFPRQVPGRLRVRVTPTCSCPSARPRRRSKSPLRRREAVRSRALQPRNGTPQLQPTATAGRPPAGGRGRAPPAGHRGDVHRLWSLRLSPRSGLRCPRQVCPEGAQVGGRRVVQPPPCLEVSHNSCFTCLSQM